MSQKELKIGVLVPESSIYPTLGKSFRDGLKIYLKSAAIPAEFVKVDIGTGSDENILVKHIKDLVEDEEVDMVTGFLGDRSHWDLINRVLEPYKCLLLANTAGVNLIFEEDSRSNIFINSLNVCKSQYLLGKWGVENYGSRVFSMSAFLESGYQFSTTANQGIQVAGAQIGGFHSTHVPKREDNLPDLMRQFKEQADKLDWILTAYSREAAVEFIKAYHESGLKEQVPILGSTFLLEREMLDTLGEAADNIHIVASWTEGLENAENKAFKEAIQNNSRLKANLFSLLGYETGLLLEKALEKSQGNIQSDAIGKAFSELTIQSPRGELTLDEKSHRFYSSDYLFKINPDQGERMYQLVNTLDEMVDYDHVFTNFKDQIISGWKNIYLCI